jgi:hypothetical protein
MRGRRARSRSEATIMDEQAAEAGAPGSSTTPPGRASVRVLGEDPPEDGSADVSLLAGVTEITALLDQAEPTRPLAAHQSADDNVASQRAADSDDVLAGQTVRDQRYGHRKLSGLIEYATPRAIKGWACSARVGRGRTATGRRGCRSRACGSGGYWHWRWPTWIFDRVDAGTHTGR